jgi:hypothetical protein
MTVEECYGFWRYMISAYHVFSLLRDREGIGKEVARVWADIFKDFSKDEVFNAFKRAYSDDPVNMPGAPIIADIVKYERKQAADREEMRRRAEERRKREELEKDPEYQRKKAENMKRLQQMMKEFHDAVTPDYLKNKDK